MTGALFCEILCDLCSTMQIGAANLFTIFALPEDGSVNTFPQHP